MANKVPSLLLTVLFLFGSFKDAQSASNSTNTTKSKRPEEALFDALFQSYDKRVRPVSEPREIVQLKLGVTLTKVVKMNSKEQELTTNVMIIQTWNDPNLKWNVARASGVNQIFVDPNEIWTPDIALKNNADTSLSVAGHDKKFQTRIMVSNTGKCMWRSPATFRSACTVQIRYWPFDIQKCLIEFGSYTMGVNMLNITLLTQKSKYSDRFDTSGDWDITKILTKQQETKDSCCPNKFSTVKFEVHLKRKPLYFMLYVISPCAILCLLTLMSFFIPSASGERIGFITTILLAMTVYLLLVQQILPETSTELPLVGLFFIVTIGETALVLFMTIIVLRCFHKEGDPPQWLQRFFTCTCCKKKKGKSPRISSKRGETYMNGRGLEMLQQDKIATDIVAVFSNMKMDEDNDGITWQKISDKLNWVFFVLCVIIMGATYAVIYTNAASITEFDDST